MISKIPPRAPHQSTPNFQQHHHSPNAALLIDFDNVTMGIRSDLGKELKSLLNSEVIRGKVAVQRAYADWRRYPQYIVPLAESSIDLIFAPAYGSAKKNATDLRMAIDAIELVFTRPEIGTFILMTGDSDFSSCVLKLKEYGKYVIGVGMRESSSDLLIQNCDEYYSYHSLSGLTRAGEVEESSEDPWVLVKRAAQQMIANRDVMRTDRLKQVMLELDPGFDEKKIGYSKFSRFVQEAATKGLIRLRKGENGQSEIVAGDDDGSSMPLDSAPPREERERSRGRGRGGDRGRGRDRDREPRAETPRELAPAPAPEAPSEESAAPLAPTPAPVEVAASAPETRSAPEPRSAPATPREILSDDEAPVVSPGLPDAYALLQEAVRSLTSGSTKSVRDGDVKRKMLGLLPGFDEAALGFSKFTRFLRQAHDAEAIDLKRVNGGNYEVSLPASGKRLHLSTPLPVSRGAAPVGDAPVEAAPVAAAPSERAPSERPAPRERERPEPRAAAPAVTPQASAAQAPAAPRAATPAASAPAAPVGALRGGRRGGRPLEGPPPILPGQGVPVARPAAAQQAAPASAPVAAESAEKAPTESSRRGRGGRGRGAGTAETVAAEAEKAVAQPAVEMEGDDAGQPERSSRRGRRGRGRGRRGGAGEASAETTVRATEAPTPAPASVTPAAEAPAAGGRGRGRGAAAPRAEAQSFSAAALGLPSGRDGVLAYITGTYRGVGGKTAESLVDALGDDVFRTMQEDPDRIRQILGEKRAEGLLEQWRADPVLQGSARKQGKAAPARGGAAAKAPAAPAKSAAKSRAKAPAKSSAKAPARAGSKSAAKSAPKAAGRSGAKKGSKPSAG